MEKMKGLKTQRVRMQLPPETIQLLAVLAGGERHRAAYVTSLLRMVAAMEYPKNTYLPCMAEKLKNKDLGPLKGMDINLPPYIIGTLDRLSGGRQNYTVYMTALAEAAAKMPAASYLRIRPKISAPRLSRTGATTS